MRQSTWTVRRDLTRAADCGSRLASVGINGVDVSNVTANPGVTTPAFVPQLVRLAEALRPGNVVHLEATPDRREPAPVDYVEIVAPGGR